MTPEDLAVIRERVEIGRKAAYQLGIRSLTQESRDVAAAVCDASWLLAEVERLRQLIFRRDEITPCAKCGKKLSWQFAGDGTNCIEVETGKFHDDCPYTMEDAPLDTFRGMERKAAELEAALAAERATSQRRLELLRQIIEDGIIFPAAREEVDRG